MKKNLVGIGKWARKFRKVQAKKLVKYNESLHRNTLENMQKKIR